MSWYDWIGGPPPEFHIRRWRAFVLAAFLIGMGAGFLIADSRSWADPACYLTGSCSWAG